MIPFGGFFKMIKCAFANEKLLQPNPQTLAFADLKMADVLAAMRGHAVTGEYAVQQYMIDSITGFNL